jgi:hypothetical protein
VQGLHEATTAAVSIVQQHRGTPQADPVQPPALPVVQVRQHPVEPSERARPKAG